MTTPSHTDRPSEPVKAQVRRHFSALAGEYRIRNYEAALRKGKYPDIYVRHLHILRMLAPIPPGKALEIGVGGGELMVALHSRGHEVYGVDLSREMVIAAVARLEAETARRIRRFATGDMERLPFRDGVFDLVVAAGVIEYLPTPSLALSELRRVLRPGGALILSIRNRFALSRPLVAIRNLLASYSHTRDLARGVTSLARAVSGRRARADEVFARNDLPWRFERTLREHGFERRARAFYHFGVFPAWLERRAGRVFIPTALALERFARTPVGYLGRGCIFLATRVGARTGERP